MKKRRQNLLAIDLCAGAGGWSVAARGLPIDVALAVEFWPPAAKTYEINHPRTTVWTADVRDPEVQDRILNLKPDLILGGIPCEWLTRYRSLTPVKQAELDDQRKTLDAVLAIVRAAAPRFWCLEDVPALVKHLPMDAPHNVINARNYSAQRRKRVFVGCYPLPDAGHNQEVLRDKVRPGPYRIGPRAFDRTPQLARTFTNTTCLAAPLDRKAPTILKIDSQRDAEVVIVDDRLPGGKRQFEWQECAVIQGFPTDYLFYGSPTDVARQVARAIQIDTGRAILQAVARKHQETK